MKKIILLIDVSRGSGAGLVRGIAQYSHLYGPWTFYRRPPFYLRDVSKTDAIKELKNLNADGIIMLEQENIEQIISLGLPTVTSLITRRTIPGVVNMVCNDYEIGRIAAEHFFDRGFIRFAFCGYADMFWSCERARGFEEKIRERDHRFLRYDLKPLKGKNPWQKERKELETWLRELPRPVGLFGCNDDLAEQVVEACRGIGINVPEEIAVLGVDNDEILCNLSNPPLSSVSINFEKAGFEAARILDQMIMGDTQVPDTIVPRHQYVVQRQSTNVLAMEDRVVAEAIRFIRENRNSIIQVSDVAEALAMSRRNLELRFKKTLGRTISQEIRHMRVEQIIKMMMETNSSISKIALDLGYSSIAHIARFFKNETGMTPQEYRTQSGYK